MQRATLERNNPKRRGEARQRAEGAERKHTKRGEAAGVLAACRQLIECH